MIPSFLEWPASELICAQSLAAYTIKIAGADLIGMYIPEDATPANGVTSYPGRYGSTLTPYSVATKWSVVTDSQGRKWLLRPGATTYPIETNTGTAVKEYWIMGKAYAFTGDYHVLGGPYGIGSAITLNNTTQELYVYAGWTTSVDGVDTTTAPSSGIHVYASRNASNTTQNSISIGGHQSGAWSWSDNIGPAASFSATLSAAKKAALLPFWKAYGSIAT
jgi:hypothetical protein